MLGISQIIRCAAEEHLPWLSNHNQEFQPHDEPGHGEVSASDNYFKAPQFYCVETICAPCGVVIAWTKFDKACAVLCTAIVNRAWNTWKPTTQFIMDSYHYINHRTTDYLCRTWCNPAPLNGSQPNLVTVENDKNGEPHYKCAFNTQVNIYLFILIISNDVT